MKANPTLTSRQSALKIYPNQDRLLALRVSALAPGAKRVNEYGLYLFLVQAVLSAKVALQVNRCSLLVIEKSSTQAVLHSLAFPQSG